MKSSKKGYIYILSNKTDEVLYIGVTSDLLRRLYEHRNHSVEGFTDKYNVTKVLYYEGYDLISDAIQREKQIKGWRREKKLALIKTFNPELKDMYDFLMESESGGDTSASSV
ncbi:MAG: GIY-YIG nuclease family protein [Clostridia bacterium]|nr:GIY-YIG nuclease family protein [Clostridia bacterium]